MSPAYCQEQRENKPLSPIHGIISAREDTRYTGRACTLGRARDVQTAHWTGIHAGNDGDVRLIVAGSEERLDSAEQAGAVV